MKPIFLFLLWVYVHFRNSFFKHASCGQSKSCLSGSAKKYLHILPGLTSAIDCGIKHINTALKLLLSVKKTLRYNTINVAKKPPNVKYTMCIWHLGAIRGAPVGCRDSCMELFTSTTGFSSGLRFVQPGRSGRPSVPSFRPGLQRVHPAVQSASAVCRSQRRLC